MAKKQMVAKKTLQHPKTSRCAAVKIIDLPGGQISDPLSGKHYSLPFLPATP